MLGYAAVSFVVAMLAGTGVGGGGLFILYLAEFCSYGQFKAQAINLVFFIFAAAGSLLLRARHRSLDTSQLAECIIFSVGGTLIGTVIRTHLPENVLRTAFGIFLCLAGLRAVLKKSGSPEARETQK